MPRGGWRGRVGQGLGLRALWNWVAATTGRGRQGAKAGGHRGEHLGGVAGRLRLSEGAASAKRSAAISRRCERVDLPVSGAEHQDVELGGRVPALDGLPEDLRGPQAQAEIAGPGTGRQG